MQLKYFFVLAVLAGCSPTSMAQGDPFNVYPFKIPEVYQQALAGYRTGWQRVTGFEHSGLHWQQFIAVYINQGANVYANNYAEYLRLYQDADEDETDELTPAFKTYQPGTIVLKENFGASNGSPDTPLTITMMLKREPGYDPQYGDWQYVQFDKNAEIILSGKAQDPMVKPMCGNCHMNIAERDYIFANFYSKPKG